MGLAAIRPLKLLNGLPFATSSACCSGFGRYQAVETIWADNGYATISGCSGFGRYQAVETWIGELTPLSRLKVAVGLAAIRPLKH